MRSGLPGVEDPIPTTRRIRQSRQPRNRPRCREGSSLPVARLPALLLLSQTSAAAGYCVLQARSEEHTSELQSRSDLVCRLLLEKKKKTSSRATHAPCC